MTDKTTINQPMPKPGFNVSYVCRYESELDRQIILDSMGHYIESIIGTREILFIKVPVDVVNKTFRLDPQFPGEEVEFTIDHRKNNIVKSMTLVGNDLPPLWSVMVNDKFNLRIIVTIEPGKYIIDKNDLHLFEQLMLETEVAPKEYDYDALKSVHWNDDTVSLRRDLEFFIVGKRFFDDRDMPYSRSYLLHGPPGNGKTQTIKAIAKFLNTKPETFDFSAQRQSPDREFLAWVLGESERIGRDHDDESHYIEREISSEKKTPIRLLALEDLDRLFPKDTGAKQTCVTLQAILQALDGAIERRNMIIVATANNPKDLDQQVLARPGRFDKQMFFAQPSIDDALTFVSKLFDGENVSQAVLKTACKKLAGHSYALHKELFATSASYTIERLSRVVEDCDVEKAIVDMVRHIDVTSLKSERKSFGFG